MKGCGMNRFAHERTNAVAHLPRRSHRISKGKHLLGLRLSLFGEAGNAVNQHRSFSCTGSSHDQHRPMNVRNGFALAIVGKKRGRMRLRLGDSHRGPEYHHDQQRAERGAILEKRPKIQGRYNAEATTAVAAIAAVSARRMVLPSEAEIHPEF